MSSPAVIDHNALGLSRVIKQFQGSPNFLAYLSAQFAISNELEAVLQQMLMMPDWPSQIGAQLDIIGRIVGCSRLVPESSGLTTLDDPTFRLVIAAAIIRNNSHGTCEDILAGINAIIDCIDNEWMLNIDDLPTMRVGIAIGALTLSDTIIAVLRNIGILARATGVRIERLVKFNTSFYQGMSEDPTYDPIGYAGAYQTNYYPDGAAVVCVGYQTNAFPFGEEDNPNTWTPLAEEF